MFGEGCSSPILWQHGMCPPFLELLCNQSWRTNVSLHWWILFQISLLKRHQWPRIGMCFGRCFPSWSECLFAHSELYQVSLNTIVLSYALDKHSLRQHVPGHFPLLYLEWTDWLRHLWGAGVLSKVTAHLITWLLLWTRVRLQCNHCPLASDPGSGYSVTTDPWSGYSATTAL